MDEADPETTLFELEEQADVSDNVRTVFEDLKDDAERQGGCLEENQIVRLVVKRDLSAEDVLVLRKLLLAHGIETPQSNGPSTSESTRDSKLLTAQEEKELGRAIIAGMKAKEALTSAGETERGALIEMAEAGEAARQRFIKCNLRLVKDLANEYRTVSSLEFTDLVQEGTIGLMKAVERFNPLAGFRFSTYATWWIHQSITRAIADKDLLIRLPVHRYETIGKFRRAKRLLARQLQRDPTIAEIAVELRWTEGLTQFISELSTLAYVSIDSTVPATDGLTLAETLSSPNPTPDTIVHKGEIHHLIEEILDDLKPREREILQMRFGIHDDNAHTLEQIGEHFGLTRERIRQIEEKALGKVLKKILVRRLDDLKR